MVFFMPTMAAVTTTAGYFLASKMGLITGNPPVVYWTSAVAIITTGSRSRPDSNQAERVRTNSRPS